MIKTKPYTINKECFQIYLFNVCFICLNLFVVLLQSILSFFPSDRLVDCRAIKRFARFMVRGSARDTLRHLYPQNFCLL